MPRQYGYMENGVFTPVSDPSGSNAQGGIGQFTNDQWNLLQEMLNERSRRNANAVPGMPGTYYAANNYGVPYSNAPRYGQRFYGPGGMPTDIAIGSQFAAPGRRIGVRYNYQPRYTGNGYAPRGYNTNMNYGPWYGQQSYATYPPYAPYQPRYEWMPGSNGQPVAVRLGEYQREQPVAFETMFNSQGVPVRVPVYAPMNNSAMPVRMGTDVEGRPYGNLQQRPVARVRNMPEPVPVSGYNVDNPGNTGYTSNSDLDDEQAIQNVTQALTSLPSNTDVSTSQGIVPDANGTLAGRIAAKEQEIAELRKNTDTFGTGSAIVEQAERDLKELKKEQSKLARIMKGSMYGDVEKFSDTY